MTLVKANQLLARVNFPLYTVHCLTERHILVAGGGGSAKTGIRNVIEIYELTNSNNGCWAQSVAHFETGSQAIMNCVAYNSGSFFILFTGMEGLCQLYKLKLKLEDSKCIHNGYVKASDTEQISNTIRRKHKSTEENIKLSIKSKENGSSTDISESHLIFEVKVLDSFQTDFSDDPFQKLVRFSSSSKILATAGADGHFRVWKYPDLRMLYEVHAHNDDVDDMDISPEADKIITVSRDGCAKIWNATNGVLICELKCELPSKHSVKYIYRGCRFAVVEGNTKNPVLFITQNPTIRKKRPLPTFLSKWNGNNLYREKIITAGNEMLSTMAISEDGYFIGLGTQEGSVKIYIAFSLQMLYRADHVHSIFVTGLEFLKSSTVSRRIAGGHEASLISISVDNHINIHHIPQRRTVGVLSVTILFTIALFIVFIIMDFFNL